MVIFFKYRAYVTLAILKLRDYLCLPSTGSKHTLTRLFPDQVILKSHIIMYFHLLLNNIQTFIHHTTDPLYLGLRNYHINCRTLL